MVATPHDIPAGFIAAWNRHDMDSFATLFAEDANFVNAIGTHWTSRAEIVKNHRHTHATIFKDSRLSDLGVTVNHVRPDVAVIHWRWQLQGQRDPDGATGDPRDGIFIIIASHEGGEWLVRSAQNTDVLKGVFAPPIKN